MFYSHSRLVPSPSQILNRTQMEQLFLFSNFCPVLILAKFCSEFRLSTLIWTICGQNVIFYILTSVFSSCWDFNSWNLTNSIATRLILNQKHKHKLIEYPKNQCVLDSLDINSLTRFFLKSYRNNRERVTTKLNQGRW